MRCHVWLESFQGLAILNPLLSFLVVTSSSPLATALLTPYSNLELTDITGEDTRTQPIISILWLGLIHSQWKFGPLIPTKDQNGMRQILLYGDPYASTVWSSGWPKWLWKRSPCSPSHLVINKLTYLPFTPFPLQTLMKHLSTHLYLHWSLCSLTNKVMIIFKNVPTSFLWL